MCLGKIRTCLGKIKTCNDKIVITITFSSIRRKIENLFLRNRFLLNATMRHKSLGVFASVIGAFPEFDCAENSYTLRSRLYHPIILNGMLNSSYIKSYRTLKSAIFDSSAGLTSDILNVFSPNFFSVFLNTLQLSDFVEICDSCFFHDSLLYISVWN